MAKTDVEKQCYDDKAKKESNVSNINTNAAKEQGCDQQGSPPSRSSTSSWIEEPVVSNMDITTGHIILVSGCGKISNQTINLSILPTTVIHGRSFER